MSCGELVVLLGGPAYASAPTAGGPALDVRQRFRARLFSQQCWRLRSPPCACSPLSMDPRIWRGHAWQWSLARSGEELLHSQGRQVRAYPFVITRLAKALQRGEVEAVVYNKAILSYMSSRIYGWKELRQLLPHTLVVEELCDDPARVAVPLRESINRAVLHIIYSAGWKATVQRYMATDE